MSGLATWVTQTSSITGLQVGVPSLRATALQSAQSAPWFALSRQNAAAVKTEKKTDGSFTKKTVKKLSNRSSSDDSDSGPCYSDYERTPGTKAGERGSCRPKKKKKKKTEKAETSEKAEKKD